MLNKAESSASSIGCRDDPKRVLSMFSLIQPEFVWLAVAFTVLMAGMLAAAAE